MKKLISLLLAAMMLLSMSAFAAAEEEAGFDEYELGVEGEQEVGFMTMSMVYFQPVQVAVSGSVQNSLASTPVSASTWSR